MVSYRIKTPGFTSFLLSPAGRWARILMGVILMVGGFGSFTLEGQVVAWIGFLPMIGGAFDICVFAPLLGGYFSGAKMRMLLHQQLGISGFGSKPMSWIKA